MGNDVPCLFFRPGYSFVDPPRSKNTSVSVLEVLARSAHWKINGKRYIMSLFQTFVCRPSTSYVDLCICMFFFFYYLEIFARSAHWKLNGKLCNLSLFSDLPVHLLTLYVLSRSRHLFKSYLREAPAEKWMVNHVPRLFFRPAYSFVDPLSPRKTPSEFVLLNFARSARWKRNGKPCALYTPANSSYIPSCCVPYMLSIHTYLLYIPYSHSLCTQHAYIHNS